MPRALTRSDLAGIDVDKLGPDSPLRELIPKGRNKPRHQARDTEHQEQAKLFAWAEENVEKYPALEWLFAIPNFQGFVGKKWKRIISGQRMNAEGRKRGVPDVLFPERRGSYVGLAIEMKSPGSYPNREQRLWLAHLRKAGWLVDTCYSFEEARDLILAYLSGTPTPPPRD
jgi:hypothetical protein